MSAMPVMRITAGCLRAGPAIWSTSGRPGGIQKKSPEKKATEQTGTRELNARRVATCAESEAACRRGERTLPGVVSGAPRATDLVETMDPADRAHGFRAPSGFLVPACDAPPGMVRGGRLYPACYVVESYETERVVTKGQRAKLPKGHIKAAPDLAMWPCGDAAISAASGGVLRHRVVRVVRQSFESTFEQTAERASALGIGGGVGGRTVAEERDRDLWKWAGRLSENGRGGRAAVRDRLRRVTVQEDCVTGEVVEDAPGELAGEVTLGEMARWRREHGWEG
jgi:hypothetical protein